MDNGCWRWSVEAHSSIIYVINRVYSNKIVIVKSFVLFQQRFVAFGCMFHFLITSLSGASVIYSDTICDLGAANELANYGEYSGAPSEQQTYEYAKTILSLMTKEKRPEGKVLIIGGGIANFTNVAATFKGIVKALQEYQPKLVDHNVKIFVRRAGPNYQEGLRYKYI